MIFYVFGIKEPIAPLFSLQVAERTLRDAGYNVFDPASNGKMTVAASHAGLGIMVTVLALDADGGTATTINAFCTAEAAGGVARITAEAIYNHINHAMNPGGQVRIPRLPQL